MLVWVEVGPQEREVDNPFDLALFIKNWVWRKKTNFKEGPISLDKGKFGKVQWICTKNTFDV